MQPGKPYTAKQGKRTTNYRTDTINTGQRYTKTILRFNRDTHSIHPTQTPVSLCEYLIKTYTNAGDLVLDNCMGSGSTAIACLNTDRNYIGYELDYGYYQAAQLRIVAHSGCVCVDPSPKKMYLTVWALCME